MIPAQLRFKLIFSLVPVILFGFVLNANAQFSWDENMDGDLSSDNTAPTALMAAGGINSLIGFSDAADQDFFTITVPQSYEIVAIELSEFTNSIGNRSYFAVATGTDITLDGTGHLAGMLIEEGMEGTDILDDLGMATVNGTGFTGPLPSGQYTFWYQENSANTTYQLDFVVSQVPEPGSALLLGTLGAFVLVRRKRA